MFSATTITIIINNVYLGSYKKKTDRDRTRTCNPQIRSLVPYPLGHMANNDHGGVLETSLERVAIAIATVS